METIGEIKSVLKMKQASLLVLASLTVVCTTSSVSGFCFPCDRSRCETAIGCKGKIFS